MNQPIQFRPTAARTLRLIVAVIFLVLAGRPGGAGAQTLTILWSFSGPDGESPRSALVLGSDGNFYGTTESGGMNLTSKGTIFEITPAGQLTTLYSFCNVPNIDDSCLDGAGPYGPLVQGADGNFYGTTASGGTNSCYCGTVFMINSTGALKNIWEFSGGPDGADPPAGLAQGSDGNFYGTTSAGGTSSYGTVFKITAEGTLTTLLAFDGGELYGGSGANPSTALVQGTDGNFYGGTPSTVFKITPAGTLTGLGLFSLTNRVGRLPTDDFPSRLVQASDSYFYGTTYYGGTSTNCHGPTGCGTIFRVDSEGDLTTLYYFGRSPTDGAEPVAGLAEGPDGSLYGTTVAGGAYHDGTVFRLSSILGLCRATIVFTNVAFPASGGVGEVIVTATNCAWTASTPPTFITITSGSSGSSDGTAYYSVAANTSTKPRTSMVYVADGYITVTQGAVCDFTLSPPGAKFTGKGGAKTVKATTRSTGCAWTAASNDPFIALTGATNGVDEGTVSYTVASNADTVARLGTMTIASEIFTVDQAAATCEFSLGETNAGFGALGGSSNVTVTANGTNCPWKAVASGSFIEITSATSSTGDGTVDYTVSANTKPAVRKGTITVGKEKLTILQSGPP